MLLCYNPYESVTIRIHFWKEKHDDMLPLYTLIPTNGHRKLIRWIHRRKRGNFF